MDFLTPEAGQKRRNWLEAKLGGMWEYVPPELRPFVALGNEMNPVTSMERAGTAAQKVVAPNVSGWDRMAAAGDMASNMAGVVAPMVAASKGAVPAVQAAEDALMGWSASSPAAFAARDFMVDEFGGVGFRAYHGSPHDFDRFSLDKIGTGEGAQAYGHGLYFAEREGVARGYRDALGKPEDAASWLNRALTENPQAVELVRRDLARRLGFEPSDNLVRDIVDVTLKGSPSQNLSLDAIDAITASPTIAPTRTGRMYEVQINADPNDFLDWDKPLSEQPAAVRDALGPRLDTLRAAGAKFGEDPDGYALWQAAHPQGGVDKTNFSIGPAAQATERLREAGIPGIRYLDAGSRGAGDGSRNYVVFDDKLIEILRKYGLVPGMIGAGAYGMQPTEAQAGQ